MTAIANKSELVEVICASMAQGRSLRQSCKQANLGISTFLLWTSSDPALDEQYTRAREAMLDAILDETLALCDAPIPCDDHGKTDVGLVNQRRLQVDTRKWLLSKLAPQRYGDRLDVTMTDARISIRGALQDAQHRLATVIDVTPKGGAGADEGGSTVTDTP